MSSNIDNTERLFNHARLSERVFQKLGTFIERKYGIKMPPIKRIMLESRLQKRLRALKLKSFEEYSKFVFNSDHGRNELVNMVDLATTNKTDFFREPHHFDFLLKNALPALLELYGSGQRRPLRLWSAGCSTGEEPYTLAMALSEHAGNTPGFRFDILASDLSTSVLEAGRDAIYSQEKVDPIPYAMKRKYLLRSRDRESNLVRMTPDIRSKVRFEQMNFMDEHYSTADKMDIIFCRNVIIYFDRPTQRRILSRLAENLIPGGYLFVGHSETLNGLGVPVEVVGPTVHRRPL